MNVRGAMFYYIVAGVLAWGLDTSKGPAEHGMVAAWIVVGGLLALTAGWLAVRAELESLQTQR